MVNNDAWATGCVLRVGGLAFRVVRNAPSVSGLTVRQRPMVVRAPPHQPHPETSIFLLGENGSNDHAKLKSENGFVKQNRKLVHKYGFRFSVRASEQAKQKNRFFGIWAPKPEFS